MIRGCLFALFCLFVPLLAQAHVASLSPPDCGGPRVQIIDEDADWDQVNGANKYYCVKSGDYTTKGTITLTAAGSSGDRRWIVYNGPEAGTHPVDQAEANRAIIRGLSINAGFWVIHEMTIRETARTRFINHDADGDDVIFNRVLVEGGGAGGGQHGANADRIHIQNSVYRNTELTANKDNHCIAIKAGTTSVHIYSNEIYNCAGDGIQIGRGLSETNSYGGIEIVDNDMYITTAIYSDCTGNLYPNGTCACAENAIDIKNGTNTAAPAPEGDWLKILNNRTWGFRRTDDGCGGTGSQGAAIITHDDADYVLIRDNIVFDSRRGIRTGAAANTRTSIINNFITDIWREGLSDFTMGRCDNCEVYYNTVLDSGNTDSRPWIVGGTAKDSVEILCNTILNTFSENSEAPNDYNAYFDANRIGTAPNDLERPTVGEANHTSYHVITKRWTNPTVVTFNDAVIDPRSPHWDLCNGANVGSTADRGVDDHIYSRLIPGFIPPVSAQP